MPPPPPPPLMDELVEEILLRLPPDSPLNLVRAGLVCKRWCHLVSDLVFQRRFREHHRWRPILGFLNTNHTTTTSSFMPQPASGLRRVDHPRLLPLECRHGRVLLHSNLRYDLDDDAIFVVWDPITGERVELPNPAPAAFLIINRWTAAVLCAAAPSGTCDHLNCHGGPFIVVLLVQYHMDHLPISSYVYSSEYGAWSEPTLSLPRSGGDCICWLHTSLLVGNALYFVPLLRNLTFSILQYDLGTREIVAINPPNGAHMDRMFKLIATKDGRLGFVSVENTKLVMYSRDDQVSVGDGRWALCQVIDLEKLFPGPRWPRLEFGSAEDTGVIVLRVQGSRFVSMDLWSGHVTEVDHGREETPPYSMDFLPYMAFITPVLSRPPCTDDGPRVSASSA